MPSDIVVVGSINIDLVINAPKVIKMGETLHGEGFFTGSGGKGANQACAIGKLGGDIAMIGCVGDDSYGKICLENLKGNGVDLSHIEVMDNISTGVALIVLVKGDNCIILDQGANKYVTPQMIEKIQEVIKNSKLIVSQFEVPYESVCKAFAVAKDNGVTTMLNPAPSKPIDDKLYSLIDILIVNEHECFDLTGIKVTDDDSAQKALSAFKAKGIKEPIITLGAEGAVFFEEDKLCQMRPPKVEVVDTTSAGDAFIGALAVLLVEGKTIKEGIDYANKVASITVSRRGAQSSIPNKEEVK
ncbi:ribokinase [Cellulosilyticum sp. I15G10I2]|uniref:ribokinase n=1 Tax=Cellulosilyticum sp. I15G10I2 TaxID=1892843 RepID=UPI000AB118C2|nr:ribokinase [Cellulosilyticum sp. I15G10I2]